MKNALQHWPLASHRSWCKFLGIVWAGWEGRRRAVPCSEADVSPTGRPAEQIDWRKLVIVNLFLYSALTIKISFAIAIAKFWLHTSGKC